jgi:acylphosphatase
MSTERRLVLYSGRVQGVGFRFTAQRLAQERGLSGQVRNLPDGRVELIAEGSAPVLEEFLAAIQSELGDKIHDVSVSVLSGNDLPRAGFFIVH